MVLVRQRWKATPIDLANTLHFPKSPVNILSITYFGEKYDNTFSAEGHPAFIGTQHQAFVFKWDSFTRTIVHPFSNLPEMPILPSTNKKSFASFVKTCDAICSCNMKNTVTYFTVSTGSCFKSALHCHDPIIDTSMIKGTASIEKKDQIPAQSGKVAANIVGNIVNATTTNSKTGVVASKKVSWIDVVSNTCKSSKSGITLSMNQERFHRWHEHLNHLPFSTML